MLSISEAIDRYKKNKYDNFRLKNPEYKDFTDEQIEQMDPLTMDEVIFVKEQYVDAIQKEVDSLEQEIASDEETIKNGRTNYQMVCELNQDLVNERRQLARYRTLLQAAQESLEEDRRPQRD